MGCEERKSKGKTSLERKEKLGKCRENMGSNEAMVLKKERVKERTKQNREE